MTLENVVRDLLVESKNKTNIRYDEYLIKKEFDLIDIVEIYLKIKTRDNLSFESSNSSMRSMLKRYFDQACSRITINKDAVLKHLNTVHKQHKNNQDHFDVMTNEINKVISNLREINKTNTHIQVKNVFESTNDKNNYNALSKLHEAVSHELMRRNIYNLWQNVNIHKNNLIISWKDGIPDETVLCKETFLISDCVGNRDENIGAYYGLTNDNEYILIPQGIGYLNSITGNYNSTKPYFYNNQDVFVTNLVDMLENFYNLKYK